MKFTFEFDEEMWKKAAFCSRCGSCRTVHAEQIEGQETGWQCPSGTNYFFESYYPSGRNYAAVALQRGQLDWSDRVIDSIYSCTTCGFCQYTCERTNVLKPTEIIRWMRSKAVEAGVGPLPAQKIIVQNLDAYDNPWGQPRARRTNWTRGLGFKIKDLSKEKEKAEVLFYPGCTYAYDPRITQNIRDIAALMHEAGVDFGILGNTEKCCGSTAFNLGYVKVLEKYGAANIETFNNLGIKTIVTPCAGCYNTIKNVYAQLGECKYEVKHTVVMLAELIKQEKLKPTHAIDTVVTYHDPCHLGRHGEIYDAPREILMSIPGLKLIEMNRIREYAFCCGGGGGVRTGKLDFAMATARRRIKEAEGTGAELLVTACPFCEQNFLDYMDASGSRLDLVDVVELLKQSVFGEQEEKKKGGKLMLEEVKKKLQDVLGEEWVSDEPVDRIPYSRDLITDGLKAYAERRPDIVVMPGSTQDVQNVMKVANQFKVPVHLIGGGSTLLGGSIPVTGGIMVDMKRMKGISLDKDNLTVTVEAGVFVTTLTGYFKEISKKDNFHWRPYFTGAPGPSLNNATNIFQGINKFAGLKYGVGIQNILSLEIVLPDGTVFNTSTGANIFGINHWMQGPGPTLTFLPFIALGSMGICTKITWTLHPLPEACQSIWAYYEDFDTPTACLIELLHKEIGRGLFIMPAWTQGAYSAETREEGIRLAKASPKYMLGLGIEGTKRAVQYQSELARKIIEKSGGRIPPPELVEVYRGHEQNIKGWGQSNSPRLMRHLGMIMTNMAYLSVDQVPEYVKLCTEGAYKVDDYINYPEPGFGEIACGAQLYTYQWGHFVIAEFIFAYDHTSPEHCKAVWDCMHNMGAVPWMMGTGPWTLGRDQFVPNLTGNFYDVAKQLKNSLDPQNIMNPGIAFAD